MALHTPSPKRSKVSPKSPKDYLFDLLKEGARSNKKAGWYLNMIRKKKDANGRGNENGTNWRLSEHEKKQLWFEVCVLELFRETQEGRRAAEQRRSKGRYQSTSAASKALTTTYLVETAWGLSKMYLPRMRKFMMKEEGINTSFFYPSEKKGDVEGLEGSPELQHRISLYPSTSDCK